MYKWLLRDFPELGSNRCIQGPFNRLIQSWGMRGQREHHAYGTITARAGEWTTGASSNQWDSSEFSSPPATNITHRQTDAMWHNVVVASLINCKQKITKKEPKTTTVSIKDPVRVTENENFGNKYVGHPYSRAETYTGHVACCSLVSHGQYAEGQTYGLTPDNCIMLSARHSQHNKRYLVIIIMSQ